MKISNGCRIANIALCEGRHDIPNADDGAMFPQHLDPTDTANMERLARQRLDELFPGNQASHLNLFVTGLTAALISVLNVCYDIGLQVTLWHYNIADGQYYPQAVRIGSAAADYAYDCSRA